MVGRYVLRLRSAPFRVESFSGQVRRVKRRRGFVTEESCRVVSVVVDRVFDLVQGGQDILQMVGDNNATRVCKVKPRVAVAQNDFVFLNHRVYCTRCGC